MKDFKILTEDDVKGDPNGKQLLEFQDRLLRYIEFKLDQPALRMKHPAVEAIQQLGVEVVKAIQEHGI